jgi:R3H domain
MHSRSRDDGPRRPNRRGRPGRDSRPARGPRDDRGQDRDRSEQEFTDEMHARLQQFLASDEQGMALEPMNSFKRRIVHNLAKDYQIETESRGEERERHVYLIRTTSSTTPADAPRREPGDAPAAAPRERTEDETDFPSSSRVWDFGSQTFPVNPGNTGVHIAIKRDGSIEIFQEKDRNHVVAERVVTSRQFRVRKGKIVQPGEPGW